MSRFDSALAQGVSGLTLQHRLGGYREYAAPAALAPFCEAVWWYRTPRLDRASVHRVLPDPALNIEFTYRRDASGYLCDGRLLVSGPKATPQVAGFDPGREIVAAKVKLEWMTAVTGLGPAEYRNAAIDLHDVAPRFAASFVAGLADASTIEAISGSLLAMLARHVAGRLRRGPDLATCALDLVRGTRGICTVASIADRLCVSARYLRRVVYRDAGVSIKTYARTVRLLHAVTLADAAPSRRIPWAAVAAAAGFYDQPHLIRECQALCDLAPGEVLRERRTEVDDCVTTEGRSDT